MNDTKITLSPYEINNRFPIGHQGGKEITTPTIPEMMAGDGAFRSTANDLLKYISANLAFLHTKLDDVIQIYHLIIHSITPANPMNYNEYVVLDWRVINNLRTETLSHKGAINGWNALVGFIPSKQIGVVLLCRCDSTDADTHNLALYCCIRQEYKTCIGMIKLVSIQIRVLVDTIKDNFLLTSLKFVTLFAFFNIDTFFYSHQI